MNNIKKMMSHLLVLSVIGGGLVAGVFSSISKDNKSVGNYSYAPTIEKQQKVNANDYSAEEMVDEEELTVTISASNVTETSQSIDVSFRSKTSIGFNDIRQKNFIISVNDPLFRGTKNPVPDPETEELEQPFDRYEEIKTGKDENGEDIIEKLPVFDGAVAYILGTSKNNSVYIPNKFIWDKNFIIEVTSISANCITEKGAEYHNKNKWKKVKDIFLPKEIVTAEPGAFTSIPADVTIHYEGQTIPEGFAAGWVDNLDRVVCQKTVPVEPEEPNENSEAIKIAARFDGEEPEEKIYLEKYRTQNIAGLVEDLDASASFIVGCSNTINTKYSTAKFNRPLVIEYDVVKDGQKTKKYQELELTNTLNHYYDAVGDIRSSKYQRTIAFRLEKGEEVDDASIRFHNIMRVVEDSVEVDTSKTYCAIPKIAYGGKAKAKQKLSDLVSFKRGTNGTFAGYSIFSLSMNKNLSLVSERFAEPHSAYLDLATNMYIQNEAKIKSGEIKIRYLIYNLYKSSALIKYKGKGGEIKTVQMPIKTDITYQILERSKGNKVSLLFKNSSIGSDFSADKVVGFELVNVTMRMELITTSSAGSLSIIGKTGVEYKFGYLTVFEDAKSNAFNWNIFLIIFLVAYVVLYAAGSYILFLVMKEKYKNDEFRRVNNKKFFKTALLDGLGFGVIAYAILFLIMRTTGFLNTIAVFNPVDPLLIGFAIAGAIIGGYFIVSLIKRIKVANERRKAIKLRLNEDVDEDGTN